MGYRKNLKLDPEQFEKLAGRKDALADDPEWGPMTWPQFIDRVVVPAVDVYVDGEATNGGAIDYDEIERRCERAVRGALSNQ